MLDRTQQPTIQSLEPIEIISPERRVLSNGIPMLVFQTSDAEVVRVDVVIKGGLWDQSQPLQALFANRMLREGTTTMSSNEISERMDFYGAWLELSMSMDYSYMTLYSLSKHIGPMMEIVRSMILEPSFPEKELGIILEKNKQQFAVNGTKVDVLARKAINRSLLGLSHPGGKYAVAEDYDRITPEVLKQFHHQHYHTSNCTLFLSGNISPEVIHVVEEAFGKAPWGLDAPRTEQGLFTAQPVEEKRVFVERPDALQSAINMGCLCPEQRHPDFPKLKVMMTLFGGYFGSRLMTNIREDKGYTYGVGGYIASYPGQGLLLVGTQADNRYVEPIIEEVYKEIDRLQTEPVSDEELTMVKSYMMGENNRAYEGPFAWADAYIALQSTDQESEFLVRSQRELLETTPEDIQRLANLYLNKAAMKEVVVGKKL